MFTPALNLFSKGSSNKEPVKIKGRKVILFPHPGGSKTTKTSNNNNSSRSSSSNSNKTGGQIM